MLYTRDCQLQNARQYIIVTALVLTALVGISAILHSIEWAKKHTFRKFVTPVL